MPFHAMRCWEVKETPYVQEVYGQTDGEDNAYEQMYTRAQAEVTYIEGSVPISVFRFCRTRYCPVCTNMHTQVIRTSKYI